MGPDTKEREVKSLVAYHKRYPESRLMIITMDEETDIQIAAYTSINSYCTAKKHEAILVIFE